MSEFENKVAIVTGAASGIGQAAAWALAAAGATVFAADLDEDGLGKTTSGSDAGGRITAVRCDITSETDVRTLVEAAERAGGLAIAINCAGVAQPMVPFETSDEALFNHVMRVNAYGTWLCMQHEVRVMLARGRGSIVNVASVSGLGATPRMHAYVASKHAVIGLTRTVGYEVADRGVRINAVCPGATATPMALGLVDTPGNAILDHLPVRRMAEPREIASAIQYLASDAASYVFATTLVVDGGLTAV